MKKRGQVTIFIIIAIVIVAGIVIFFAVKGNILSTGGEIVLDEDVRPVYNFIKSCIKETGLDGAYFISQRGGYFVPPNESTEFGVPYYLIDVESYVPPKERIEKELADYIDEELFFCTRNFVDFRRVNVKSSDSETRVKLLDDKIIIDVVYPVTVIYGNSTALLKDFKEIVVPLRLKTFHSVANNITQNGVGNPGRICLSCIIDLSIEYDLLIEMYDYDNDDDVTVFNIIEKDEINNRGPFEFKFAHKYENVI